MNATTPLDSLELSIKEKCGDRMQRLLRRVVREFPSAHVVVTNYYNMFSKDTADDRFTRMLVKRLADQGKEAQLMTDRQMREKLLAISERWYEVSTSSLAQPWNRILNSRRIFTAANTLRRNSVFSGTCLCRPTFVALELQVCGDKSVRPAQSASDTDARYCCLRTQRSAQRGPRQELQSGL